MQYSEGIFELNTTCPSETLTFGFEGELACGQVVSGTTENAVNWNGKQKTKIKPEKFTSFFFAFSTYAFFLNIRCLCQTTRQIKYCQVDQRGTITGHSRPQAQQQY